MQENNSIIIAMLEELLTISKSQQAGQRSRRCLKA